MSVEADRRTNRRRRPTELALPEPVARDDARRRARGLVVCRREQPAEERLNRERGEEIAADPQRVLGEALVAARGQVKGGRRPGEDTRKTLLLLADAVPLPVGELGIAAAEVARRCPGRA